MISQEFNEVNKKEDAVMEYTEQRLKQLEKRLWRLVRQKKSSEAVAVGEQIVRLAETQYGSESFGLAVSLNNAAMAHKEFGDSNAAEPLYKRAMGICERLLDDEPADDAVFFLLGIHSRALSRLYVAQGRLGEAERIIRQTQASIEESLGEDHPAVAWFRDGLAAQRSLVENRN